MINFGVPSTLRRGSTTSSARGARSATPKTGSQGLLRGRRAILVLARGGVYSVGPMRSLEHDESYLRSVLGFIGITDVQSIVVEGVALGPEIAERAVDAAMRRAGAGCRRPRRGLSATTRRSLRHAYAVLPLSFSTGLHA